MSGVARTCLSTARGYMQIQAVEVFILDTHIHLCSYREHIQRGSLFLTLSL